MWPCTQNVEVSLIVKAAVVPAWMYCPGSTIFWTTVP